ncbi:glycosyltransferase family 4 protein [Pontibacter pamirensis]|uniref:glycosyltransferase family 4 protein n=1 Tax=Pontibacter pamirensis TaxID=2562824 RepID=UPI00138A25E1|nr:glycosyltransferase family 4 protein [Pontibacter pamirensis]
MNVLITSPSLDLSENVSGISSVVTTIIKNNTQVNYIHFLSGKKDGHISAVRRLSEIVTSYVFLIKLLIKDEFESVHLNLPLDVKAVLREAIVFLMCKAFNKPVLTHLHGGKYSQGEPPFLLYLIVKYVLKNSKVIVALSELERQILERRYQVNAIKVLQNTVDYPSDVRKKAKDDKVVSLLFLGRLDENKGLKYIIEAVETLNKKGLSNHFSLTICGKGPLDEFISEKVKEWRNISYMGVVGGEKKKQILNSSDVFILPSLYEGLPVALLEAMAYGVVPIVTAVGAMKLVVENGKNGFIVEYCSATDLSQKIESLLLDRDALITFSGEARKYISTNYNMVNYIESLNKFYIK